MGRIRAIDERWWLTYTEAGDALGVSRWTIHRMVRDGILSPVTVGRSRVIRKSDIDAYIAERQAS